MPVAGPLVPRNARWGGLLLLLGSVQFVVVMIAVQLRYPGYSDLANHVSDLGGVHSPWAAAYNVSAMVLGVLVIVGSYLLASGFPKRTSRSVGLGLLMLAGAGAFLTGLYPEQTGVVHGLSAELAFVAAPVALLLLTFAMFRDTRWEGFRAYTLLSGLVGLTADLIYVFARYPHAWAGGLERLIIAPVLLWPILVGIHLLRLPSYRPPPLARPHLT
jgi:hypothetical membrane protein